MTLQRRLMLLLLLSAPLVWIAGLVFGVSLARVEINELFDTQQIRLARQVLSTLPSASIDALPGTVPVPASPASIGDAELDDLSIAVWDRNGHLLLVDREGVLLPVSDAQGFVDLTLEGEAWRAYYLPAQSGEWKVAIGQKQYERDELVWGLLASQLVPWVLTLPVLLLVMAGAVRQALKPVRTLTAQIDERAANDPHPLSAPNLPVDLQPLLTAINTMLTRIAESHDRERRFVADAAHELRTPLAALQAQWDAQRLQAVQAGGERRQSQDKITDGISRMGRLVTQLLWLSRADQSAEDFARYPVDWPVLVERLFGELLPMADRGRVELECLWPPAGTPALALQGDADLIAAMLRNLLDNAIAQSAPGQTVRLRFSGDAIEVLDEGPGVDEAHLAQLGERFFRPPGQAGAGSGLGLSIVARIAALHGLKVSWANRKDVASDGEARARGFMVRLSRDRVAA